MGVRKQAWQVKGVNGADLAEGGALEPCVLVAMFRCTWYADRDSVGNREKSRMRLLT